MSDNLPLVEKLIKVLALTSSEHDGEALAALRQARQMLMAHGLSLSDLAVAMILPAPAKQRRNEIDVTRGLIKAYEARIANLQQQNSSMQKDLILAERAIARWRELAESTGRDSSKHQIAADKWRTLARHTADQLWELGQQLQALDGPVDAATDGVEGENIVSFTRPHS